MHNMGRYQKRNILYQNFSTYWVLRGQVKYIPKKLDIITRRISICPKQKNEPIATIIDAGTGTSNDINANICKP